MYVVDAAEMRALDRHTIDILGIPGLVLMENAGREVARIVEKYYADKKRWIILAGKGNNGGDGLVIARHLSEAGFDIQIVYAQAPGNLTGEAAIQRDIVTRLGLPTTVFMPSTIDWQKYDGVIDALLGTGSHGAPREPYGSIIQEANNSGLSILAVDIPSGMDADSGNLYEPCIQADRTVSLAFIKQGLTQYPGKFAAGKIDVVPIGIPTSAAHIHSVQTYLLDQPELEKRLQIKPLLDRKPDSHKGTYGHGLLLAGSLSMSGAGILCAKAMLRTGCGLVTWALPETAARLVIGQVPEAMLAGIPDLGRGDWSNATMESILPLLNNKGAVAIGPGIGQFATGEQLLRELWESVSCPLVIDADGLNIIAKGFSAWPIRQSPTIFTPHPGEMARLTNLSTKEIQADRIRIARKFAKDHSIYLVLKGAHSVIATPEGEVFINTTGNAGMATGGSGDVLTGIITGLLAQGFNPVQAVCFGTYLHGCAGDHVMNTIGRNALLAGDIVNSIGSVLNNFE